MHQLNAFAIMVQQNLTKQIAGFATARDAAINAVTTDLINQLKTAQQALVAQVEKDVADAIKYFSLEQPQNDSEILQQAKQQIDALTAQNAALKQEVETLKQNYLQVTNSLNALVARVANLEKA